MTLRDAIILPYTGCKVYGSTW